MFLREVGEPLHSKYIHSKYISLHTIVRVHISDKFPGHMLHTHELQNVVFDQFVVRKEIMKSTYQY